MRIGTRESGTEGVQGGLPQDEMCKQAWMRQGCDGDEAESRKRDGSNLPLIGRCGLGGCSLPSRRCSGSGLLLLLLRLLLLLLLLPGDPRGGQLYKVQNKPRM